MPRISARFEFILNLEPSLITQINSFCDYSVKANLMQGDESILWLPLKRTIPKNEHYEGSQIEITEDCKFRVNGSFSCKLRQGVAPFIQSKKKEFSLNILATHVLFKNERSKLIEIDVDYYYAGSPFAIEWRLY